MNPTNICPECKAVWEEGTTCQEYFHQMLFWESENPGYGVVHHLLVLCYHLQHPSLYSPEGLDYSRQLLVDFLERGLSTQEVRQHSRAQVSSTNRKWKVTGWPGSQGEYQYPVQWKMTARDVVSGGAEHYVVNVRKWAERVLEDLRVSGNVRTGI